MSDEALGLAHSGQRPSYETSATEPRAGLSMMPGEESLSGNDAASNRRLFYVADWLPPEFGAVGQYALLFARELAQSGRHVSLIGLGSGDQPRVTDERLGNGTLEIKRLRARHYNKSGMVARLIWSLGANARLISAVVRDPRSKNAQVLFTGSPPFMLFFAIFVKWLRGAKLIYRITDFYPEVLIAALGKKPFALGMFERVTWWFRRSVDEFEALGGDQRLLLINGGIASQKIRLKRDVPPIAITGDEVPAPVPDTLKGCKILLYSGNYGVAHEVETVIGGLLKHHRAGGVFGLWLNASGSNVQPILRRLQTAGVPVVHTEPGSLDTLPNLLAAADAHLITLRPSFSGLVLPSKVYGCLSSRRPIIFIGPKGSDVHYLCSNSPTTKYEQVEPGDIDGFAGALNALQNEC